MQKAIGIIGYGNMGSAIAERIKSKYKIWIFDRDKDKTPGLTDINIADSCVDLVTKVEVIILAIKPQDFDDVLSEIKSVIIKDKLVISIAAGVTTEYIEKYLGEIRVVRVIPNMPARFGRGVSCICKGKFATRIDMNLAIKIFSLLGVTFIFTEDMMNAATAVSGSGPGYFYDFLESEYIDHHYIPKEKIKTFSLSFKEAAELIGFTTKQADRLVDATIKGSLATIQATEAMPATLKKQIVSKGGTTEAALEVLHRGGSMKEALAAAVKRAEELSKKE